MKKILVATNILLLGIIVFYACNPNPSGVRNPTEPDVAVNNDCLPRSLSAPLTSEEDGSIDAFLAQRISQNYANDPYKGFIYNPFEATTDVGTARASRIQDTRSVWFDLRKLKSIISSIENSVCDNNCKIPLKLGIRVYFAKYDPVVGPSSTNDDLKNLLPTYGNRHTVFFVATYDGGKGNHIDFDPMNVGNQCTPTPFKQLLLNTQGNYRVNTLGKQRIFTADSTVENHGDLMPPPDGTGTFPTGGN